MGESPAEKLYRNQALNHRRIAQNPIVPTTKSVPNVSSIFHTSPGIIRKMMKAHTRAVISSGSISVLLSLGTIMTGSWGNVQRKNSMVFKDLELYAIGLRCMVIIYSKVWGNIRDFFASSSRPCRDKSLNSLEFLGISLHSIRR